MGEKLLSSEYANSTYSACRSSLPTGTSPFGCTLRVHPSALTARCAVVLTEPSGTFKPPFGRFVTRYADTKKAGQVTGLFCMEVSAVQITKNIS